MCADCRDRQAAAAAVKIENEISKRQMNRFTCSLSLYLLLSLSLARLLRLFLVVVMKWGRALLGILHFYRYMGSPTD